jgi:hypothetical protein
MSDGETLATETGVEPRVATELQTAGGAIDVHAHFLPASYRAALHRAGLDRPDNIPGLPGWDVETQLATMDSVGIAKAMLSISSPGVLLPNNGATVELARTVNDEGAALVRDSPGRSGCSPRCRCPTSTRPWMS